MSLSPDQTAKAAAGRAAVRFVQKGMRIGLGTGSTVEYFLQALGERCRDGLVIQALASSIATEKRARALGIPLADPDSITALDITVDGADEVDSHKRLIKGGGGALLREKILAYMAEELIVIVDASKIVSTLGKVPLPLEIIPFAQAATRCHLEKQGFDVRLRHQADGTIFITDNGNYILDVKHSLPYGDIEGLNQRLRMIPGIVETGFFCNMSGRVLIGYNNGNVETRL
jgi:ribose 5-phosphate isomerase A